MVAIEARPHRPLQLLYGLTRPEDRQSKGMILPKALSKDFMHEVVGIVLVHFYLFQDHASLTGDVFGIENWVQHQVAENVHRDWMVLVQDLDIEADTFLGGECVHIAADGINLPGNRLGGPGLCTLEYHVLDEMGDTVPPRILVA